MISSTLMIPVCTKDLKWCECNFSCLTEFSFSVICVMRLCSCAVFFLETFFLSYSETILRSFVWFFRLFSLVIQSSPTASNSNFFNWKRSIRRDQYIANLLCCWVNFVGYLGPFYWHILTLIPAWIRTHMPSKVWNEITYPSPTSHMPLKFGNW